MIIDEFSRIKFQDVVTNGTADLQDRWWIDRAQVVVGRFGESNGRLITVNIRIFLKEPKPVLDHPMFWWRILSLDNTKEILLCREEGLERSIGYGHPVFPNGMDDVLSVWAIVVR